MQPLEESVERSERRFRAIVSLAADAIVCIDGQQRITMFNDGAERIFGYARAEILGEPLSRLIPAQFHARHSRHVERFGAGRPDARHMGEREPVYALRSDGEEFPAQATISRIDIGGDPVLTVILRDITEQKNAERLLEARVAERTRALEAEIRRREQAQDRLVRAQRMEAFGQLTGGVAHDFNNLLTVLSGNLELLEQTRLDERQLRLLRRALGAAATGARLTQRLLTFARRGRLEPVELDLNEEVIAAIELLRRTLGETIMISAMLSADLWTIAADPSEVESAILNLAINARDAMPSGGTLTIETSNVEMAEPAAPSQRFEEISPGAYVRLSISDTGTGMSPDVLKRAFEPFFTTKEPGRGTGLGLATTYGFAKQSNGHLTIHSEVGRGTTVSLYLPRVHAAPARRVEAPAPSAPASGAGKTILVVEDDPGVRDVALERLAGLGYRVLASASGPAAIAKIEEGVPIDLVFSDIVMSGGMSGDGLARWLAAHRSDLPLLLTSGFAEELAGTAGEPEGMKILRKPYSTRELAEAIQEILRGRATPAHAGRTSQAKT